MLRLVNRLRGADIDNLPLDQRVKRVYLSLKPPPPIFLSANRAALDSFRFVDKGNKRHGSVPRRMERVNIRDALSRRSTNNQRYPILNIHRNEVVAFALASSSSSFLFSSFERFSWRRGKEVKDRRVKDSMKIKRRVEVKASDK